MSDLIRVTFEKGPWNGQNWSDQASAVEAAIGKLGRDRVLWSWYEPDPVALLDTKITRDQIQPLFRPGVPDLPEGMVFEHLMLFGERRGVTLRVTADGLSGVHWYEDPQPDPDNPQRLCRRVCEPALLRNAEQLSRQYGLHIEEPFSAVFAQSQNLLSYLLGGEVVAFTLLQADQTCQSLEGEGA